MRIGIDARLIEETGVGRYIRNLIAELGAIDTANEYVVFLREKSFKIFRLPNARWQKVLAEVPWHTVTEQLRMPFIFSEARLDLLHVPYFNVPIFYRGPFVLTIHDLTILHFDTGKASTLPWILYQFRRWGYRTIVRWGIMHARFLLAVSEATKREILDHFPVSETKITVTHEGVDKKIAKPARTPPFKVPYFLYVGNAYPHKNVEGLLAAFEKVPGTAPLVLVGKDDFFYKRLRTVVAGMKKKRSVIFFGPANDRELATLYAHARALVFPSFMEGFGLPALEALAAGTPVICSDIPVFHEVLGDAATYVDPRDADDIARALVRALEYKKPGNKAVPGKYDWRVMAEKTLTIYEGSARL